MKALYILIFCPSQLNWEKQVDLERWSVEKVNFDPSVLVWLVPNLQNTVSLASFIIIYDLSYNVQNYQCSKYKLFTKLRMSNVYQLQNHFTSFLYVVQMRVGIA